MPPGAGCDLPVIHVSIGDCAFARRPALFTTVLGSCVSATFHHPDARMGGMFHAMLPDESLRRRNAATPSCTFASLAVEGMVERLRAEGLRLRDVTVKLFGGANMMQAMRGGESNDLLDVGRRNVEAALTALAGHGLTPKVRDVFGGLGRKLYFSTQTGEVWLSRLTPELARQAMRREQEEEAR